MELLVGVVGTAILFNALGERNKNMATKPNMGTYPTEKKAVAQPTMNLEGSGEETLNSEYAKIQGIEGRQPFQSCVDQQGTWISSNLLPKDAVNVSDDWNVNTPGSLEDKNFLEAGHHFGVDTVGSSHKNANYQLRAEPIIPRVKISPFMNSSIMPDDIRRGFEMQDF